MPPPSSVPQLKILRAYAQLDDASLTANLPPTVHFSHTRHTLTVFDAYPKALFHFLVLPRLRPAEDEDGLPKVIDDSDSSLEEDLTSLRTLLRRAATEAEAEARARVGRTLGVLADEATRLQGEIEREMLAHYGFTWPIWVGFHAVPSME
jgi:aprataxin